MGKMVVRNLFALLVMLLAIGTGHAADKQDVGAEKLRTKYSQISDALRNNPYGRPIYMESHEYDSKLTGDIYAVVGHSFDTFTSALDDPKPWCDVLLLHLNIKFCKVARRSSGTQLSVNLGRKSEQPLSQTYQLDFSFDSKKPSPDYFRIDLGADSGPLGTHDYRIVLEAIPLKGETFMHLTYSYGFGLSSRIATNTYLSTMGRDKVGFTITGKDSDGKPEYVDGVRGVIERNTMRYYLAIDAYLGGLDAPPGKQFEKQLQLVIDATEEYPLQLHEVDRATYRTMKRHEHQRQQEAQASL